MRRSTTHATATLLLLLGAAACSDDETGVPSDGGGGAGSTTTSGGGMGGGGDGATTSSTSAGGGGEGGAGGGEGGGGEGGAGGGEPAACAPGEERCVDGEHLVCEDGELVESPCGDGEACDPDAGACVACACDPAEAPSCLDATSVIACADSCLVEVVTACDDTSFCQEGACVPRVCAPGAISCDDGGSPQLCNAIGSGWEPAEACAAAESCVDGEGCVGLCELADRSPSSVGCSFFGLNMDNYAEENADAIVVTNPNAELPANVSLLRVAGGVEAPIAPDVVVPPGGTVTLFLPNGAADVIESISALRTDFAVRVASDVPVAAAQHSPLTPQATNDASLLLPEGALGTDHVVPSYLGLPGNPGYLVVIGTEEGTVVEVTAATPLDAGEGIAATAAGTTQQFTLGRHDVLQLVAQGDLSGARVVASAPVAVFGAAECAGVPFGAAYCDHIEEQVFPVAAWGTSYVAAKSPPRAGTEPTVWRFFAGDEDTTIVADPPIAGFPLEVAAGTFAEVTVTESFVATGDAPFMAVQYLVGQSVGGAGTGDPAMSIAVPTDRFLDRYTATLLEEYTASFLQILRPAGVEVRIDGVAVDGFTAVGAFEVADVAASAGVHVVEGDAPFGLNVVGFTTVTSYAHPGGLSLAE